MASSTFVAAPAPKRQKMRRPPPLQIPDRLIATSSVSSLPSHCYDLLPLPIPIPFGCIASPTTSSCSPSLLSPCAEITAVKFPAGYLPSAGATRRGTRRQRNEDRVFSGTRTINVWGICDGHGGTEVVDAASQYLSEHLSSTDDPRGISSIFRTLGLSALIHGQQSGTTITAAKILPNHLLQIVHLGDSKACLVSDTTTNNNNNNIGVTYLTKDHIPSNAHEERTIRRNGGMIINGRVNGILGVTRALGNKDLNGIISTIPDTSNYRIRNSGSNLLILASDGFFDVISSDALREILNLIPSNDAVPNDLPRAAETLINEAVNRQSTDDISVVLVDLRSISAHSPT